MFYLYISGYFTETYECPAENDFSNSYILVVRAKSRPCITLKKKSIFIYSDLETLGRYKWNYYFMTNTEYKYITKQNHIHQITKYY